jgi:hypothetical protein
MTLDVLAVIVTSSSATLSLWMAGRLLSETRRDRFRLEETRRHFLGEGAARSLEAQRVQADHMLTTYSIGATADGDILKIEHAMTPIPGTILPYWVTNIDYDDPSAATRFSITEAEISWRGRRDDQRITGLVLSSDDKRRREVATIFVPPLEESTSWKIRCSVPGFFDAARKHGRDHVFFIAYTSGLYAPKIRVIAPVGHRLLGVEADPGVEANMRKRDGCDVLEATIRRPKAGARYEIRFAMLRDMEESRAPDD